MKQRGEAGPRAEALADEPAPSRPIRITPEHSNVDEDFHAFVQSVYGRYGNDFVNIKPDGALLLALRSFVTRMLEYMRGVYELLDEVLLQDFRKSLFKAFAFNCGLLLATGIVTGSSSTPDAGAKKRETKS